MEAVTLGPKYAYEWTYKEYQTIWVQYTCWPTFQNNNKFMMNISTRFVKCNGFIYILRLAAGLRPSVLQFRTLPAPPKCVWPDRQNITNQCEELLL